jgi:hypothetical protein
MYCFAQKVRGDFAMMAIYSKQQKKFLEFLRDTTISFHDKFGQIKWHRIRIGFMFCIMRNCHQDDQMGRNVGETCKALAYKRKSETEGAI